MRKTYTKLICDGCGLPISTNCNEVIRFTEKSPVLFVQIQIITTDIPAQPADLCAACRKEFYTQASWHMSLKDPLNNIDRKTDG